MFSSQFTVFVLILVSLYAAFSWLLAHTEFRYKTIALFLFLLSLPFIGYAFLNVTGTPRILLPPISTSGGKNDIIAAWLIEGDGIYYFLADADNLKGEPILVKKPWDQFMAEKVREQKQQRDAGGDSSFGSWTLTGNGGGDGVPEFFPEGDVPPKPEEATIVDDTMGNMGGTSMGYSYNPSPSYPPSSAYTAQPPASAR